MNIGGVPAFIEVQTSLGRLNGLIVKVLELQSWVDRFVSRWSGVKILNRGCKEPTSPPAPSWDFLT